MYKVILWCKRIELKFSTASPLAQWKKQTQVLILRLTLKKKKKNVYAHGATHCDNKQDLTGI